MQIKSRFVEVVLPVAGSLLLGAVSGAWAVRGSVDTMSTRVTVNEGRLTRIEGDIVPRQEHEMYWRALNDRLTTMQSDIRDIRRDQLSLLRQINKVGNNDGRDGNTKD